jgi:hypothetical protein
MNNDRAIIMTIAAIALLLTVSVVAAFLAKLPTAIAASSTHGRQQCDPSVTVCRAGTTGSSKDLGKKEQQGHQPVAQTQTAPTNPENNGLKGSDNRRTGGDTILKVPIATSGNNVYLVWPSNKTGNSEISFRISSDNGHTFDPKINLSNDTSQSVDPEIKAEGDHVYVSWWEHNATNSEPVLRVSNDNGKTFGPIIMLSSNATSGS